MTGLLERGDELALLDGLLRDCRASAGGAVFLEGPAGIGKSALLAELRAQADAAGIGVLAASGGELERDFPFAVARQLFEPAIHESADGERLLEGAAQLASPVLAPQPDLTAGGAGAFAIVHGLYWLAMNLARERPLLLIVDDAHWADPPSLRFLVHLARRLDGLPIGLAVAARPGEPDAATELLGALALGARTLSPAALSEDAVGTLLGAGLGRPEPAFVAACHASAGGNPFLTGELIAGLARDGVEPTAAAAATVETLGPDGVRHAIALRLARLPDDAGALARAAATLGENAPLRLAAAVAAIDEDAARASLDLLAGVDVLRPELPLAFVHPIVRAAVAEQMSPAERTAAHRRAAELLAADEAEPERVAIHLLACGPTGDPWVASSLRAAARSALARGVPDAARTYLERALAEPPAGGERAALTRELGHASALAGHPAAAERLEEALRLTDVPAERGAIFTELSELHVFRGEWDASLDLAASGQAELGDDPAALAMRAHAVAAALYTPRLVDRFDREEAELRTLARSSDPGARGLALAIAAALTWRLEDPAEARELIRRGLDDGRLLAERGAEFLLLPQAIWALAGLDDLDAAGELAAAMVADAERRGSVLGVSLASTLVGQVELRRGRPREAEAGLRAGFDLAIEHALAFLVPSVLYCGIDALLERPGMADAAAAARTFEIPAGLEGTITAALLLEARAHTRLAAGETDGAADDLRRCGELFEASRLINPTMTTWRATLAVALRDSDPAEAERLAAREAELAARAGTPRARGVATRTLGLVRGGEEGVGLLREAVAELERSPSPLELARTQVDLGAALRRGGNRREADEPLRQGLDLAWRIGAVRRAERAARELRVAGGRPRRRALGGVEALTASELRVAELVATGLTNQQVAERLFLTAKTVENHLGRIYRKLDIHARGELAAALGARP
jgi:DNA-binding CsgD family transcriptional regulator